MNTTLTVRPDAPGVWRIYARTPTSEPPLCGPLHLDDAWLFRASLAARRVAPVMGDAFPYWPTREVAEQAMAAAQRALGTPEPTTSTEESIACPHCGEQNRDLWDHDWGSREEIETDCGACEEPFTLSRSVTVTYTATPKGPKIGKTDASP